MRTADTPQDRILWNDDTCIDELVLHGLYAVHIEQMDARCWWIALYLTEDEGPYWMGNFIADPKGRMEFVELDSDGITWDEVRTHEPEVKAGPRKLQDDLDRLRQDNQEVHQLIGRLSHLLTGVVDTLKGPPARLSLHDWSDLPRVADQFVRAVDVLYGLLADDVRAEVDEKMPELAALAKRCQHQTWHATTHEQRMMQQ